MALCSIIAASMGSTLTLRRESKVEKVDIGQ
jgi:inner membrane transporter RhtA